MGDRLEEGDQHLDSEVTAGLLAEEHTVPSVAEKHARVPPAPVRMSHLDLEGEDEQQMRCLPLDLEDASTVRAGRDEVDPEAIRRPVEESA